MQCSSRQRHLPSGRVHALHGAPLVCIPQQAKIQRRQDKPFIKFRTQASTLPMQLQRDDNHTDQAQLSQSNPRCPFGGRGSEKSLQPELPPASASNEGKALNLSVSLPSRDYLAFKDEAYKIDLRLERTTIDDIFEIDEEYEADMKRKAHILATRPAKMMLPEVPGCEPAQQEVLNLAVKVLTKRFPDRFQQNGSMLTNASTGEVFDVAEKHRNPMDIAARLVQEDIAVMQKLDGRLILSCGAVVSPLGWSGNQKMGLDLAGIHQPVPQFNDGPALKYVSKIFERGLKAEVPLTRANWFIMHTGELSLFADAEHIPEAQNEGPITVENAGERLFLRCERQVATRLPECGGVMFTFRTYIRPLKVLEKRTDVMQRLLAAFMRLPDEVVAYRKAWHDMSTRDVAIQYLQKVANDAT